MTVKLAFKIVEVAEMLGVSEKLIDREMAAGRLERIRIGHSVRITQRQLDKYLRRRELEERQNRRTA